MERSGAEMLILKVWEEIWDFLNGRTQKCVHPKWPWNAILVLFWYIDSVKFLKNLQNFLKRCLRFRVESFALETRKPCDRPPFLKSCNRTSPSVGSKPHYILWLDVQKGSGVVSYIPDKMYLVKTVDKMSIFRACI